MYQNGNMNFTFGIVTTNPSSDHMVQVLYSIEQQNIDDANYEVIIVGGDKPYEDNLLTIIPFDETQKKGWITRKKNIITQHAKFQNIVYMHDYVLLEPDWYRNFEEIYGGCFDVCMTPILNSDGSRYRDWSLWPHDLDDIWGPTCRECLLPYNVTNLSKFMYISGAYWVAKKRVMEQFPLNEELTWGESEDVDWSKRVRTTFNFKINPYSKVSLLKQKDPVFTEISEEKLKLVQSHA